MVADNAYYEGLNRKLLTAIPGDAREVLEFGCANGRLGEAFKQEHPGARWTGIDVNPAALEEARRRLDQVLQMDLDAPSAAPLKGRYDVVVFGDVLEHLKDPEGFLRFAHEVSAPGARLVCCLPNMTHSSVIERMLAGDLMYDEAGLLDATHLRFLSPASSYKLLLDAGWIPNLRDSYEVGNRSKPYLRHLLAAANELGIPPRTALTNLMRYQLIVDCVKGPAVPEAQGAPFSVVVPITSPQQFDLNVRRSPGLREVGAEVLPVEHAKTAAEAFDVGRKAASKPWVVYCHQDVYFPRGTGRQLAALFASIPDAEAPRALIGFAGLARDEGGKVGYSGLVIDRMARFDHPGSARGVSLDELAIAFRSDTVHRLDARLGWHCWGTDVCLSGMTAGVFGGASIARVPLFHNSTNDGYLTPSFHESARLLAEKHRQLGAIPTLNGVFDARG